MKKKHKNITLTDMQNSFVFKLLLMIYYYLQVRNNHQHRVLYNVNSITKLYKPYLFSIIHLGSAILCCVLMQMFVQVVILD